MAYLPCELHCHTVHSDGNMEVKDLLKAANEDHLALVALTDHNTTSGYEELDDNILPAIKGIEWTTYFGHMLVLGAKEYVDWRDAVPNNIDEKIKQIKAVGGIVGIAHPYQMGSPMCTGGRWEFNIKDWRNVDYMEIWHDSFDPDNYENDRAYKLWTNLLDEGYHIACTYGRDWHSVEHGPDKHYGCTYVDVDGEINEQNAIAGIRMGKTVASTGAKIFFRVHQHGKTYSLGDTIRTGLTIFSFFTDLHSREKNIGENTDIVYKSIKVVTNSNKCIMECALSERHVRIDVRRHHWYRAELWGKVNGKEMLLAVTSPIYTE